MSMKKLVVLLVTLTMCIAACVPVSRGTDEWEPDPVERDKIFLTKQAAWTPDPCMDYVEDGIKRVVDAEARFSDAFDLVMGTYKASSDPANSAAFTTAMAELNRAKQAAQNIPVPDCIYELGNALTYYTRDFTEEIKSCVYDNDCDDSDWIEELESDYRHELRMAMCFLEKPYCQCAECQW